MYFLEIDDGASSMSRDTYLGRMGALLRPDITNSEKKTVYFFYLCYSAHTKASN